MAIKMIIAALASLLVAVLVVMEPGFEVPPPGAILVTGAGSGIGRHTAERLSQLLPAHHIYGTVRKEEDVPKLPASVRGIVCDLSDDASVDAAMARFAATLDAAKTPLVGFFDSAGVPVPNVPVEAIDLDLLRRIYAVDVVGLVAVLKHAIPLIRESKGRLCFMGSVTGAVTPAFFGMDPARAIEAVADAARRELKSMGVGVSVIQAGFIASPIIAKTEELDAAIRASTTRRGGRTTSQLVVEAYPKLQAKAFEAQVPLESMAPMSVISDAVVDALRSPRPRIRYVVGAVPSPIPTRLLVTLLNLLPAHIVDLFE